MIRPLENQRLYENRNRNKNSKNNPRMSWKEEYILSPVTGRRVTVGSDVYRQLQEREGIRVQSLPRFSRSPTYSRRLRTEPKPPIPLHPLLHRRGKVQAYSRPLEFETKLPQPPYIRQKLAQQIPRARAQEGRGSPTRGWSAASPKRGTQRHQLRRVCGNKCFLMPKQEKFPICPRCADPTCDDCTPDCRGILAAKIRASQWGYTAVREQADDLGRTLDCPWSR